MGVHPAEIVIAIQAIQAIGSLVLAYLLMYFYRTQPRAFLRHWARSLAALALYMLTSASSLGLFIAGEPSPTLRLVFSIVSLAAAYLHVVWLLLGAYEAAYERTVAIGHQRAWLLLASVFGVVTALIDPFDPDQATLRTLLRFDLRYLITGLAFFVAAWMLWRMQRVQHLIGIRIGVLGFALYGLQLLHVLAVSLWQGYFGSAVFYQPYIGLLELLSTSIIAMGIVIWLLETQRIRTDIAQSELAFARTHDPTTRLPNRRLLIRQLEQMLEQPEVKQVAVISLHVKRFAVVHRAFGWRQAEQLMARISNRIRSNLHSRCVIGRIAERDFMILRPTLDEPDHVRAWCEEFLKKVSRPISIQDREFVVGLNAGVSLFPMDAQHAEPLMQKSQRALTQSTQFGRGVVLHHLIDSMSPLADESSIQIEGELSKAIEQNQFVLHYQPIICTTSGNVERFEALARWNHPRRGLLGPEAFMQEALELGLLGAFEDLVMDLALGQLKRWHKALSRRTSAHAPGQAANGDSRLPGMALNLSAQRFQQQDVVERIERACRQHAISPEFVELEITEDIAIRDFERGLTIIRELRQFGVQIALDDFGTGYSSLAHLQELNVHTIKLDRGFLRGTPGDARQRKLVAAVIDLCHEIDMRVVAEGVETMDQLDFLVYSGCDLLQGFLLQKPRPANECPLDFDLSTITSHRN